MCSIPYSLLTRDDSNVFPQSIIKDHQNFCKLFLKAQSSYERIYERKKEENKNIKGSSPEKNKELQNQSKIWNWFENLSFKQKKRICTIRNKWLVKIIIQLYYIYILDRESTFEPAYNMKVLFSNQKNYQNIGGLIYKNIHIIPNYSEKKNYDEYYYKSYFTIKQSDFSIIKKDKNKEKIQLEIKLLNNIILLSLEDEELDTISLNEEFIKKDIKIFKQMLNFFSDKNYFKDWLTPFNYNNLYNFSYPEWMHSSNNNDNSNNNHKLTLCKFICGIFEQQILILYQYYLYTNSIYEFYSTNSIIDIHKENDDLEKFIKDNYSCSSSSSDMKNNFGQKKENIITIDTIMDIVNKIKIEKKFDNFKKMCDQLHSDYYNSEFYNGNKIFTGVSENVFNELNLEMEKGKGKGKEIHFLLNKITFIKLEDVINYREFIYLLLRRYFIDIRGKKIINELLNIDKNKIGKKKKKKRKNKNNPINIISNEDILNNNNKSKDKDKEKNKNDDNNSYNICTDIINNVNSSSSNDENEKENKKKYKENEDSFITVKQFKNEEIDNINNNLRNSNNTKGIKNKNKEFFLFPISNKKQKNKNKHNNNSYMNNTEEKVITDKEKGKNNNNKECQVLPDKEEKKENEKENNIQKDEKEEKDEIKKDKDSNIKKNKNIIKKEDRKNKSKASNRKDNKKKIIDTTNVNGKKNFELTETTAISIQMLNDTINKNSTSNKIISIEKQNHLEINKFSSLQETTTFFSYEPKNKTEQEKEKQQGKEEKKNTEKEKENENNEKPVNMTINIINNQYIYQQYPFINMQFLYYYHTPSELFFDLLTKDIINYSNFTCKNIEYLNKIRCKYLEKVEELIKFGLEKKYKIKFGHYGSYFTNLSIEGSDLDILVFYKPNNPNFDFLKDIIDLLNKHEYEFENIYPILSASVPVIKLQINISNEIDKKIIQFLPYYENKDISHIKIDLTFTLDENEFKRPDQIVTYINKNIEEYSNIKPLLLVLKRYFRIMKMNKSFTGGLSSHSLFLLILAFLKSNTLLNSSQFSLGKSLFFIFEKYSFFDYDNYGIDVEGPQFYYLLKNNINILYNDYENKKEEINILDPFTKINVAKSSFQVEEIKNTFNKALFFFKYEAWKYDSNNYHNFNNINNLNITYDNINNNNSIITDNNLNSYDYKENNFIIIKKLFSIK